METYRKELTAEETLDSIFELLDVAEVALSSFPERLAVNEGMPECLIREIILMKTEQEEVVIKVFELPEIRWRGVPKISTSRVTVIKLL